MTRRERPARTGGAPSAPGKVRRAAATVLCCMAAALASSSVGLAVAAGTRPGTPVPAREEGPLWSELKPAQQAALAPLQSEWPRLGTAGKQKWLELAARFPKLAPAEQTRVQARMSQWARLTPAERGEARLHYQQARQLPPDDKKARWDAYQALPPEQKQQLAARSAAKQASAAVDPLRRPGGRVERAGHEPSAAGSAAAGPRGVAVVPPPTPRAIAPALVQAAPGATTTLIDRRPTPPEHLRLGARFGGAGAASGPRRTASGTIASPAASAAPPSPPPASAPP